MSEDLLSPEKLSVNASGADVERLMARLKPEEVGDQIGPYKLLQTIGEGGFGTVWMAEQERPVRRRVALKIIKLGMDTKEVVARFEQERQALAMMEHPNIAKVFDAGATQWGRPYFAMELVRGIKITEFCDQANLSTAERLRLFILTCNAVQHAHQKGIIHRDIKPSNVLVTLHDGVAVPKVIDFGVAKATQAQRLTDLTLFTQFEQMIGTPLYMSPEQAEMSGLDIDTRTDIYSLGVLLYELLTGRTPFDPEELMRKGHDEIRRAIREQEPQKPSTFVSTMAVDLRGTIAQRRQSDAAKLPTLLRGDLDWIVMKALEKDRSRRYETANGLGRDIERHLADEPVLARPASRLYRFRRLVRRNKGAFAAAAVVVLALVIGFSVSTWSLFKEKEARKKAVASERDSESAAIKSQQVARLLQDMLKQVGPQAALGRNTELLRVILDETAARLGKDLGNQPGVEAELRETLGGVYFDLGELEKAEQMYRRGIQLNEGAETASRRESIARLLNGLSDTLAELGRLPEAEKVANEALGLNRAVHGEPHSGIAIALHHLGKILWAGDRLTPARARLSEAVAQWETLGAMDTQDAALTLNDLALVIQDSGDMPEAERFYRTALAIREKHLGRDHPFVSETRGNLGLALWYQGNLAAAEVALSDALASRERVLNENHRDLPNSCNNLALVWRDLGKLTDAEKMQRRALALVTRQFGPNDGRAVLTRNNLATVVRRRAVEAGDVAGLREALEINPADPLTADAIAAVYAIPSLTRVGGVRDEPGAWRYTSDPPAVGWINPDFPDVGWSSNPPPHGSKVVYPRTPKTPIPTHAGIWLRQTLDIPTIPGGKLIIRINSHQDAEVYINGVLAAPAVDWSDSPVFVACNPAAQAALVLGHNLLAVHCEDTDAGFPIDIQLYAGSDDSPGRAKLIEDFERLATQDPTRAEVYLGNADAHARQGQWVEARKNLEMARKLQPSNPMPWYASSVLLAKGPDPEGYEHAREKALEQFAKDDAPMNAERIVRLATLLPPTGSVASRVAGMAATAALADYPRGLAWRQFAKALADLRSGEFATAVQWCDKSLETSARKDLPGWSHERERNRMAAALLVKALALNSLHRDEGAREALKKGRVIMDSQFPAAVSDFGREWADVLFALTLRKECEETMPAG